MIDGLTREVLASFQLPPHARVLEVGIGDGAAAAQMAGWLPEGRVLGVDVCNDRVAFAQKAFVLPNLDFQVGDAARLDFEAAPFDLVVSFGALHNLDHPGQAFAPIARHMKSKARMLIQCGGHGNLHEVIRVVDAIRYQLRWEPYFDDFRAPWSFVESGSCEPWLRQAGLTEIAIQLSCKHLELPHAASFKTWLRDQFRPYVERIPADIRDRFVDEVAEHYAVSEPVSVPLITLQVEAFKP
jgi:ubiquinone/menaquinone biosynthesis C-methylase UbiE